ncbi:MAG: acetyl-CoA carboxylase biotin carboxyl carrier protein subunit [Myxococcota bacterium]
MGRAQRYEVVVEGHPHAVSVELDSAGQPVRVQVGDTSCAVALGADDAIVVRPDTGDSAQHVVHLSPGGRPTQAIVSGDLLGLEVRSAQEAALEAALAAAGGGAGGGSIEAPMPGRVVRILVTEGQEIDANAPLLIVEAMKMENEVRSPIAGIVRTIAVEEGQAVDAGQLLCELSQPEASS